MSRSDENVRNWHSMTFDQHMDAQAIMTAKTHMKGSTANGSLCGQGGMEAYPPTEHWDDVTCIKCCRAGGFDPVMLPQPSGVVEVLYAGVRYKVPALSVTRGQAPTLSRVLTRQHYKKVRDFAEEFWEAWGDRPCTDTP